jgi:hypothetical protein
MAKSIGATDKTTRPELLPEKLKAMLEEGFTTRPELLPEKLKAKLGAGFTTLHPRLSTRLKAKLGAGFTTLQGQCKNSTTLPIFTVAFTCINM